MASTSTAATAVEGVSLDKYMAQHTSEDNASFNEIVEASNKRRRLAKPWLFVDKDEVRYRIIRLPETCFQVPRMICS